MDEATRDLQVLSQGSSPEPLGPIELSPDLNPWQRQPDEPHREFIMFSMYLDLEPHERSLAKAYRAFLEAIGRVTKTAKSNNVTPYFYNTSVQYKWRERADAYDRYISTQAQDQIIAQRISSRVEMAKLGAVLRRKAAESAALIQSITAVKVGDQIVFRSALTTKEITQLAKIGAELEAMALGIGTPGGQQINVNVNTVPPSDDEIMRKAERILEERKRIIDVELELRDRDTTGAPGQRPTDVDS